MKKKIDSNTKGNPSKKERTGNSNRDLVSGIEHLENSNGQAFPLNEDAQPLSDQVRWAIIYSVPLPGAKPSDLKDDDNLKEDYKFGGKEYQALCVNLRQVLLDNQCDKPLPCSAVNECKTVKQTVELIQGIISGT